MKRLFSLIAVLSAFVFLGCKETPKEETLDVSGIYLPKTITVVEGESFTFSVLGKGPKEGDVMIFTSVSNVRTETNPHDITPKSFKIDFPKDFVQGQYAVSLSRGKKEVSVGKVQINVVYNESSLDLDPATTVYGFVKCGTMAISGAVVSDGYEVVVTDKTGLYQIASKKANGYVFVSIPSGYTVPQDGILPRFHVYLTQAPEKAERADFQLIEDPGQENHTMMFFGDIHLANRTKDRSQFATFTADVNNYITSHPEEKVYAMTLGDMTWDAYWYSNSYSFQEYLQDANNIKKLKVFHTIGNHDHDMACAGDWNTVTKYKKQICPTYYSFNIGNVHYISLDNIECTNTSGGTTSDRHYNDYVVSDIINWLKKDLAYVEKSTPIVVTGHAPIYDQNGNGSLNNATALVTCFKGYDRIQFVTGHSHKIWNVDKLASSNIYEQNSGAVCATWWWTGNYTSGLNIAQDGAPGGYRITKVSGKTFTWQFKGSGKDPNIQFRTYDRNSIAISPETAAPKASSTSQEAFLADLKKFGGYNSSSSANQVIINVWDWDPSWKVEVTENGKNLTVVRKAMYDPLFLIAYTAQRFNVNSTPSFDPYLTNHMFTVTASSATSTLDIKVTDRFGNVYTESMTRPKAFSLAAYNK